MLFHHRFRTNPPQLVSNVHYISRFLPAHQMDGYASYCLTNMVMSERESLKGVWLNLNLRCSLLLFHIWNRLIYQRWEFRANTENCKNGGGGGIENVNFTLHKLIHTLPLFKGYLLQILLIIG